MSDNKITHIVKGILYIIALIVCAIVLMVCLSNEAIFVHIPVSGSIRKMGSVLYEDGRFMLALAVFISFICPGWLLSQIIFRGNNEVRNFAVYTSAPLIIIIVISFIGDLAFTAGGFLDVYGTLIEMAVLLEVYVIVGALLIMLVLKVLRKKTVNIIIGSLFVLLYFLIAICYSSVE